MHKAHQGFTLIEVMIVVAIIGILTAIAMPSYTEYIRRGHRADARAKLLQMAQWMERVATANGTYPTDAADTANAANAAAVKAALKSVEAKDDRYAVTMVSTASTFTLTAAPKGAQVGDKCGNYTLDQTGLRGAKGVTTGDIVTDCWNK